MPIANVSLLHQSSESFGGVYHDTDISYICKDRAMWGAAGGLGPTQVYLHCRFFPGLPDYPAVAEMFVSRRHHLLLFLRYAIHSLSIPYYLKALLHYATCLATCLAMTLF